MKTSSKAMLAIAAAMIVLLLSIPANGQVEKTFRYPDDTYTDGAPLNVKVQYFKDYGDNHQLVAMTPDVVTIEDGRYTVEIPERYFNREYYMEVLFDNGYVTPRVFLSPLYDYLPGLAYVLLGALFIVFYARVRFNRWTEKNLGKYSYQPRNYTTWTRFVRSLAIYIMLTEIAYLAILISPGAIVFINKYLGGNPLEYDALKEMGQYGVLWSILLVTGVLPNFPWINKFELKLRETLHDYAFIPAEAKAVISQLEVNYRAFQPDPKIVETVIESVGRQEFNSDDFLSVDNSIKHNWCKLSYLKQRLQDWNTFPKINRFFDLSIESYEQLLKDYDVLKKDIENYNEYSRIEDGQEPNSKYKKYLAATENYITTELRGLLKTTYSLISIGVLGTEKLPAGRKRAFQFFGLSPYLPDPPGIDWDTNLKSIFAIAFAAIVPTLFYYFALSGKQLGAGSHLIPANSLEALIWSVSAIIMHGLTIILVVMFHLWRQTLFAGTNYEKAILKSPRYNRFTMNVVAGLIGYLTGFFTMVGMTVLQYYAAEGGSGIIVFKAMGGHALWAFLPFVTGFYIQWYLNVPVAAKQDGWRTSLHQGAATALVAASIAMIRLDNAVWESWYFVGFCFLASFCVGAGIGAVFPQGYRRKREANEAPEENRRSDQRMPLKQPATLKIENNAFACNIVELSMSGAKLDRKIHCPIGSRAQVHIPSLGKVNAIIVRKAKSNTVVNFPYLDTKTSDLLFTYIGRTALAA